MAKETETSEISAGPEWHDIQQRHSNR